MSKRLNRFHMRGGEGETEIPEETYAFYGQNKAVMFGTSQETRQQWLDVLNTLAKKNDNTHIDVSLDDMDKYWLLYKQHYVKTIVACIANIKGTRCETDDMKKIRHRMKYLLANVPGLRTLWSEQLFGSNKFRFSYNGGLDYKSVENEGEWYSYQKKQ
jgi:hypothetical protein